jgi:transcriptional regulator with XRE-family HTH domain
VPQPRKTSRNLNDIAGSNLRRLRNKLGVSQDEFADRAGLHRTYIGSVERGERNITLDTLQRIARALQVDPKDLLREVPDA